jgi:hypothetical protein
VKELRDKVGVQILLDAPRVAVNVGEDPAKGPPPPPSRSWSSPTSSARTAPA